MAGDATFAFARIGVAGILMERIQRTAAVDDLRGNGCRRTATLPILMSKAEL